MCTTFDEMMPDYRHLRATESTFIHFPEYGLDFVGGGLLLPYTNEQFSSGSTDRALYFHLRWWAGFPCTRQLRFLILISQRSIPLEKDLFRSRTPRKYFL